MADTSYFDLYKALKADGAVQGDWRSFHQFVGAPGKQGYLNRKKLYDALKADGAVQSSTYEEFNNRLFRGGQAGLRAAQQRHSPVVQPQRQPNVRTQARARNNNVSQGNAATQQPQTASQRALQMVAPQNQTQIPENASPFVRSLYRQDIMNDRDAQQMDYSSPHAVKDLVSSRKRNQQVSNQIASYAAANQERDRRNQPIVDTGSPEANQNIVKTQGQLMDEMNASADKMVAGSGDYINGLLDKSLSEADAAAEKTMQRYLGGGSNRDETPWYERVYGGGGQSAMALRAYNTQISPEAVQKRVMSAMDNTIEGLVSDPKFLQDGMNEAERMGVSPEEYIEGYLKPRLAAKLEDGLRAKQLDKFLPRNALQMALNKYINSNTVMKIATLGTSTKSQRQLNEEAMAMTDEGKNPHYKPGIGGTIAGVVGDVAGMVTDPVFKASASLGGKATGAMLGNGTSIASKIANGSVMQKLGYMAGSSAVGGGVTGFTFGFAGGLVNNLSTGEDTSLGNTLKMALSNAVGEAGSFSVMGVAGAPLGIIGQGFGSKTMQDAFSKEWWKAAVPKVGLAAAKTYTEAFGMNLGGYVSQKIQGKEAEFDFWNGNLQSLPTAIGFRLTHLKDSPRYKDEKGNDLKWYQNALINLSNFAMSDKAKTANMVFTKDEKQQLLGAGSVHGLMPNGENIVDFARRATKNVKDESPSRYADVESDTEVMSTYYNRIINDPNVSWDAKAKFTTMVMGVIPGARPMHDYFGFSYENINGKDGKYISSFAKDGTLLSKIRYDRQDQREAIKYEIAAKNEDAKLKNAYAIAVGSATDKHDMQAQFLLDMGYKKATPFEQTQMLNDMSNKGSRLYSDFLRWCATSEKSPVSKAFGKVSEMTGMKVENIMKAYDKDPMKRTDVEQNVCVILRKALTDEVFEPNKPHPEQSAEDGKDVVAENNLGTDQPNNQAVLDNLHGLTEAENEMEQLMNSNDIFSDNFKSLQEQGLTHPQIYDWMIQNGMTEEQLAPYAHYMNAVAKVQGMQNATAQAINEHVEMMAQDWGFHGTMDGQKADGSQMLYVQDRDGRMLIVGSGDVSYDPVNGHAKDDVGDMLVCLDPNTRETVYVRAEDTTLFQTQDVEAFKNEERQRLQSINSVPYNQAAQEQAAAEAAKPQTKEKAQPKETAADGEQPEQPQQEQQSSAEQQKPTEQPSYPTDENGEPDFAKMSPEEGAQLYRDSFNDPEAQVARDVKAAEKALKDAQKMEPKGKTFNEKKQSQQVINETIKAAEEQLRVVRDIQKSMTAQKVAETVGKPEGAAVQNTEGMDEATKRFIEAPKVEGRHGTITLPNGEKISGTYYAVPAMSLIPSHDPFNDYKPHEGVPLDENGRTINDRDYYNDKGAQDTTNKAALDYDGRAISDIPVVNPDGRVLSGNGRTMAGQLAAANGKDAKYVETRDENAAGFGMKAEDLDKLDHARIIFVPDEPLPYTTETFAKFNRNEKKTQSNTEQAVAKAKTLTADEVGSIVAEIEGNGYLDAFFNNPNAINSLIKTLQEKGIIGQNEVAELMEGAGKLSPQGKELVKNLLLGSIFKPETIRMLGIDSAIKNKAIAGIRAVMDNMKLGDYSLRDEIDQAIQLLYEARQGGNKVDTLLRTPDMYEENAASRYPSISQMMALALEGKVSDFRDLLNEYNREAAAHNTGEGDMFGDIPTEAELIKDFLDYKKWKDYDTRGNSESERENDSNGIRETEPAAQGGNEEVASEEGRSGEGSGAISGGDGSEPPHRGESEKIHLEELGRTLSRGKEHGADMGVGSGETRKTEGAILEGYAKENGIWRDNLEDYLANEVGAERYSTEEPNGESILWEKDGYIYKDRPLNFNTYRATIDNFLISNELSGDVAPYELVAVGPADILGQHHVVLRQKMLLNNKISPISDAEIDAYFKERGFEKHITEDGLVEYRKGDIVIADAIDSNFARDPETGKIVPIDLQCFREAKADKEDKAADTTNPVKTIEESADAYRQEKINKAAEAYKKAKEGGDEEQTTKAAKTLKHLMDENLKGEGYSLRQRQIAIALQVGKKEAETIDKPLDEMDSEELEFVASKNPITESEIRELAPAEDKNFIEDAVDYVNGNHGFAQTLAYLKIYKDVRSRYENAPDNSGAKDGAQLAPADNGSGEGLGLGTGRDSGGSAGQLDRGTGKEPASGKRGSGESGENDTRLSAGEQGDKQGEGNASGVGDVPARSADAEGVSATSGNGNVPERGGQDGSGRPAEQNARRKPTAKQGTTWRGRSAEEIKKNVADKKAAALAAIEQLKKLKYGKGGSGNLGSMELMTPEQIEYLPTVANAIKDYGMAIIDQGIYKVKDWLNHIRDTFMDALKDSGFTESDVDRFIKEMWNSKMTMDGETHTIAEWSSIYENSTLRKKLSETLDVKRQKQMDAEPIKVKVGDRKNIEETLPYLLPQQQEDVYRAETQFFGKEHADRDHAFGKGYMFTNGTGTGKTYTGLGIAKRLVKQGKKRILFVTPSQKKVSDWIKDGKNLGLDIRSLDDWAKERGTTATTESGDGCVITTFANFGLNKKLLETEWDAVIYDESHRIMENKNGTETARSMQHYKVTNRDENHCFLRLQDINPHYQKMQNAADKFAAQREKERKNIIKEYKQNHPGATDKDAAKATSNNMPKDLQSFAPADGQTFPKLGKLYNDFKEAQAYYYNKVKPELEQQAKDTWKNTKTVFLSATPFNTRENLDYAEGYIFKYPEEDSNSRIGSRARFYLDHFGAAYKWRYNRLESSVSNPDAVAKQEVAFSDYLQNTLGTMSGRIIDSPYDYSRDFPTVAPDHADEFNNAVQECWNTKHLYQAYAKTIGDYNYGSALFETMKVANIINRIKEHLDAGRKVVIYHRRVETKEPIRPPFEYMLDVANQMIAQMPSGKERDEFIAEANEFRKKHQDLLQWEKGLDYSMPREQIAKVFGKDNVLFFSGKESKKVKDAAVDTFNSDGSGKNILVIQEASGKEGISLHDTTGKHQRVVITLALPQSPITALQIEGRIYRIGNMSNAIFEYPILGLNSEMMLFGQKFNNQVSTTENLALGSQARNLRDSFAKGILEHSGIVPIDQQGVGGKAFDAPKEQGDSDPFDDAVLDYYSNQKLNKNNREGNDYFPTPEPLGYKMVQWAGLQEGDSVLEPSAGHGAIARYVPQSNELMSIEPSMNLFSRLQLKAGGLGRKFLNNIFENYDIHNKHDAIIMNPPFGKAGALAMQHIDKAFKHLDEGGRIVAIIPRGSMDRKFEAWIAQNKNAAHTATINLPDITFQQAGTSVKSRVVIIDKVTNRDLINRDVNDFFNLDKHYDKIEDFFEDLRNITVPDRIIDTNFKVQKKSRQTVKDLNDIKGVRKVDMDKNGINVKMKGWMEYAFSFVGSEKPDFFKKKMASYYQQYKEFEKDTWRDEEKAVFNEFQHLACKLAGMTEEEMERFIKNGNSESTTHFRTDRGIQYSKTDEKDVKNSRIIPEDVDKSVSSQIEKKFDETINDISSTAEEKYGSDIQSKVDYATSLYSNMPRENVEYLKTYYENEIAKLSRGTRYGRSSGQHGSSRDREPYLLSNARTHLAAIERELAYRDSRAKAIRDNYGLQEGRREISPDLVERIFKDGNPSKGQAQLFTKAFNIAKRLGVDFALDSGADTNASGETTIFRDLNLFLDGLVRTRSPKDSLPRTMLHEMLHQATMGAINLVKKGKAEGMLTPKQIDGVKTILDLYDKVKDDKERFKEEPYGLNNEYEFAAQMADPRQRKALDLDVWDRIKNAAKELANKGDRSMWQTFKDAIKKLFEISDKDKMDQALNDIMDDFNEKIDDISMNEIDQDGFAYKVEDKDELNRLNKEKTFRMYSGMQEVDGKLYSPMAAIIGGKRTDATEMGVWMRSDERPDLVKNGKFTLVKTDKNKGLGEGDVDAAYNPYMHTSSSMMNDQFTGAYARGNIKVVEWEIPESEKTSGYRAEGAKDAVGLVPWHSGSVNSLLPKDRQRQVMLSQYRKAVRVVPDSEVAESIAQQLKGTGLAIPWNVVTPNQVKELAKLGVPITTVESGKQAPETKAKFEAQMEELKQEYPQAKFVDLKMTKDAFKQWGKDGGTHFRNDSVARIADDAPVVVKHVDSISRKLGAKVNMIQSVGEITNKYAKAAIERGEKITGWYDEKTGEVHLYMPNIHDRYTAEKTIWHEVVGHKGMRELFGDENYSKFLRSIWYDLDKPENARLKELVSEELKYNPFDFENGIEEGIARLVEDGKGEPGFWNAIKNKVTDILHEIGYRIAPNTKDVKYLLWLGKNLQKNSNDPYWKMKAEAVRYKLDKENVPVMIEKDGVFYTNDGKARSFNDLTKKEFDEATDGVIHLRTTPSAGTALDRYHKALDAHGYMFTESYMDNMLSLKNLMQAIVPDNKNIADIKSSENPYILQNTMQGAMSNAAQMFERNVMKPLDKAMAEVLDAFEGKKDDEKIRNFNLYMITKHGLERNRILYMRDTLADMRKDEKKNKDVDVLEKDWYDELANLDERLNRGDIDLKGYFDRIDDFIRTEVDDKFDAGKHDYSGIHAIQGIEKSSGPYDDAEAIASVMDAEANMESIKKGSVKAYWDKVKAATQYAIDTDYKNGLISRELHGYVSAMFNWYVPLRKYDEATAEDTYGYITEKGDPKNFIGSSIMRARGHKYLSETNVLAQIGAMGNRAINNGGQNAIKQAFARFIRNHSDNNLVTETSVWYVDDPVTKTTKERYPEIPEDATPDEVNQIVADFNSEMRDLESKGLATKVRRRGRIGYKFERAENKSQHIVDVMIAGKKHSFIINGNPRAAQALNGLLENSKASGIMKPLGSISRMMAQLCTSYNPEFVMRNIMRDAEFASSNVTAKEGARYGGIWAKYYAQLGLYKGASTVNWKDLSGTTGLGLFAKYRNGTLDMNDKVQRYFKEFMENGGETGWVQIKNMKEWEQQYKSDVKNERSKIQKGGAAVRDFFFGNLENLNEVAENIARFSTYCASRDFGRSVVRSTYDAKEVSVNFNRHGSGDAIKSFKNGEMGTGKAVERWAYGFTASYLRHCSMFFNAGIQSTNLLVKNLKTNPVGTSINMLSIPFALGALAALGNNALIASEDEKDRKGVKDPYGELPDYIRRNNLCIYKGGGEFITIPLAIELRAFYGLGDLAAGMTFSPNVSGQKNPFFDAVGSMSQLVPVMDYLGNSSAGKDPIGETIKAISPSAISPFVEWEMNSDWKGSPIERRGDWNENSPAWQRAYNGTPEVLKNINKKVNAATNDVAKGNEDMLGNGFLDMVTNPSMLNHFFGGVGGGAATFGERLLGAIKNGKDTETKDVPFVRSLLYTPSEQTSLQRTKSKWYNYVDEMETTMANVDRLKSKNVPINKRLQNMSDYYHFQNSSDAAKVRVIELAQKQMKQWKKMRDRATDTQSVNFANQNIDRIMMEAVDELDRME